MSYRVVLKSEFHGSIDAWTESLCLEILPDGRVAITSRSAEPLMGEGWEAGEVVWPEGYDPEDDGDRDFGLALELCSRLAGPRHPRSVPLLLG